MALRVAAAVACALSIKRTDGPTIGARIGVSSG
jgi:hypothetical protein